MRKLWLVIPLVVVVAMWLVGCDESQHPTQPVEFDASWAAGAAVTGCVFDAAVVTVTGHTLRGSRGDDVIDCTSANAAVRIVGGSGQDVLTGSQYADRIDGGRGDDMLYGLQGDDRLYGGGGCDRIEAGPGDDYLEGGPGNDARPGRGGCGVSDDGAWRHTWGGLYGDEGADVIYGGPGVDALIGDRRDHVQSPNDFCDGGPGDPTLQFYSRCEVIK